MPDKDEILVDAVKSARGAIARFATVNVTLIGIGAGGLLIREKYEELVQNVGVTLFAIALSIFAAVTTRNVKTRYDIASRCLDDISDELCDILLTAGYGRSALLKLARRVRFSAIGVFSASSIIILVTWIQFIFDKKEIGIDIYDKYTCEIVGTITLVVTLVFGICGYLYYTFWCPLPRSI